MRLIEVFVRSLELLKYLILEYDDQVVPTDFSMPLYISVQISPVAEYASPKESVGDSNGLKEVPPLE